MNKGRGTLAELSASASLKAQEPGLPVSCESKRKWMSQLNKKKRENSHFLCHFFLIQVLNASHIAHLHG